MHQSGRDSSIPAMRLRPHSGTKAICRSHAAHARLVVLLAVAGRGVDEARAIGGGDIVGRQQAALVLDERVQVLRPRRELLARHHFWSDAKVSYTGTTLEDALNEVFRDNADA